MTIGPAEWFYKQNERWHRLPQWGQFLLGVGLCAAHFPSSGPPAIVAVSLPTRAYAASMCGTGLVLERARDTPPLNAEEALMVLRQLPVGSPVTFRPDRDGSRITRGVFTGVKTLENGSEYVVIEQRRQPRMFPVATFADRIQPTDVANPHRGRVARITPLIVAAGIGGLFLSDASIAALLSRSRLDCIIVGDKGRVCQEIRESPVAVEVGDLRQEGTLGDILRVRSLLGENQAFRAEVVASTARSSAADLDPPVVIFDGASSFLRWSSAWPGAHWVVLLDRTDRRFAEATSVIDELHAERIDDQQPANLKSVPIGVQYVSFLRPRDAR